MIGYVVFFLLCVGTDPDLLVLPSLLMFRDILSDLVNLDMKVHLGPRGEPVQ